MLNPYRQLIAMLPNHPLQVGDVLAAVDGAVVIELPGGGVLTARGDATPGDRVYVRDGVVEGPAPDLPLDLIDV